MEKVSEQARMHAFKCKKENGFLCMEDIVWSTNEKACLNILRPKIRTQRAIMKILVNVAYCFYECHTPPQICNWVIQYG